MRRAHRSAHRAIWIVLTIAVATGFALALLWRKPPPKPAHLDLLQTEQTA